MGILRFARSFKMSDCGIFFESKIPPLLKIEVGSLLQTNYDQIFSKIRETFLIRRAGGSSLLGAHGLSAYGCSTERARLPGGTSLRTWFKKKCLLPIWILIYFQNIPDFET